MWLTQLPVLFIWLWHALRARHLFFFTTANPTISTGGVLGESKYHILKHIPSEVLPPTLLVPPDTPATALPAMLQAAGIAFPVVAKPDVGERGWQVAKLHDLEALLAYHARMPAAYLVQAFVDYPEEYAVLYWRMPGQAQGQISSLCVKKHLSVKGDGRHSVAELMAMDVRASLQIERLQQQKPELMRRVPAAGEEVLVEPIGNHCRGTLFLDGSHLIDEALTAVFDRLSRAMKHMYYGRFDLKCRSIELLRQGREFKILEFNGVASEPAHIYDPAMPVWKKYRVVWQHWGILLRIYRAQRARGLRPMSLREGWQALRRYLTYRRAIERGRASERAICRALGT